jgi:purine catabolism regulator
MIDLIRKGKGDIPSSLLSAIQKRNAMVLCAIERKQLGSHDESGMERVVFVQLFRMVQHIFQTKGIYAWMAPVENQWAIVLADNQSYLSESFIQRTEGGFADLFQQFHRLHPHLQYQWKVGISHTFYDLTQIPQAWHQATLALSVNGVPTGEVEAKAVKNGLPFRIISYAKLQAWQLFLQLDPIAVQEFVEFHLGPLLAHDQKNGTDLVRTLEVFLQNGRQKKQTANSLFIHRQTLYYRLEQITSMLGEDWESPLRCLALEMALAGYRFLLAQQEGRPNSR